MSMYLPTGVIPACLLPFDEALEIDEPAYRSHLGDLAAVRGVTAITVNGHAAEAHALAVDEQQQALAIAVDEARGRLPIIAGIYTSNCRQAAALARMARREGAAALLVFPNDVLALGGQLRPEMAVAHLDAIASAADLPIVLFQYPLASGLGYRLETLLGLCERFPNIVAIKDWSHDPPLHERQIRELHGLSRPVKVLSTHSAWLLASLALGCDGVLSGAGSVIAELQVGLWEAVQRGDLLAAREWADRIYPTTRVFYCEPWCDMHNRMKEALVLLGRLKSAYVRPPLVKLPPKEIAAIKTGLIAAGLLPASR